MTIDRTKIFSLFVFIVAAVVYGLTCCRTVFVGDSGELSLVLTTGGIAHPPGYPLYTILGYLWLKLLFFLRPALAANLFSSVSAAATAVLLFRLFCRLGKPSTSLAISAAGALLYAFALPVWSSATNAEVYTLSGLLYTAALIAVIRFHQEGGEGRLIFAAFMSGLTLTHHFSAGVIISGIIMVIIYRKNEWSWPKVIPALISFLLPLSLYLYLLFRFDPGLPVNWMEGRSISALWGMFSGEIYRQFVGLPTIGDLILFIKTSAVDSFGYFGQGLILLAIPGLFLALRSRLKLALLLLVPAGLNFLMVSTYHIPDYEGYLIPAIISALVFIIIFVQWLMARTSSAAVPVGIACVLVILPIWFNYSRCDLSRFELAEHYGRDLLNSAADKSIVFLKSDNGSHSALYLRYGENHRADLTVYSTNSTLTRLKLKYGQYDFLTIMRNLEAGTERIFWGAEYIINQGMNPSESQKSLRGMLYGRSGDDDNLDLARQIAAFTRIELPAIDLKEDFKARQIYLEYTLQQIDRALPSGMSNALTDYMNDLVSWGARVDDPMTCLAVAQFYRARGVIDQALKWIDLAIADDPFSYESRDIYVGLGTIYRQSGDLGRAGQALSRALEIDPEYQPARYNATLVRAEMALQQQDFQAALEAFGALTAIEPDNPLPYFNMAVVYEKLPGGGDHAVRNYRLFLEKAGDEHPRAVARARERLEALTSSQDENN